MDALESDSGDISYYSKDELWNTFLKENYKKSIPKDAWNMVLDFATSIDETMSNYEDDEFQSMPVVLDDFVEYAKPLLEN